MLRIFLLSALTIFCFSCERNEIFIPCEEKTWFLDDDADGLGDPNRSTTSCNQPDGYVDNADDTDDEVNTELQLSELFDTYFYGKQWMCEEYLYLPLADDHFAVVLGATSPQTNVEAILMEISIERQSELTYQVQGDRIRLYASALENTMRHSEPPFFITEISSDSFTLVDAENTVYTFVDRSTLPVCSFERIMNADWLIYQSNTIGLDDCVRFERFRINNETDIASMPLNLFGTIATPDFPDGVPTSVPGGSNTVISINGCDKLYATFPDLVFDNDCGAHIFEFDDMQIIGDRFLCGGFEFLIED